MMRSFKESPYSQDQQVHIQKALKQIQGITKMFNIKAQTRIDRQYFYRWKMLTVQAQSLRQVVEKSELKNHFSSLKDHSREQEISNTRS
mmetsp:Transcript_14855/g.14433  ORF Transcript_14855/g.14433 Transcript_14855/m.14433 type:complete len:89 (+) Transcript_14855:1378-1644(+)